jgi:hypothetical protein
VFKYFSWLLFPNSLFLVVVCLEINANLHFDMLGDAMDGLFDLFSLGT